MNIKTNAIEKRIGIIGGGQLGKMMILEAKRLGMYVVTLDPDAACAAHSISDEHIVADFSDAAAFRKLAEMVDVITYENEWLSAEALAELEAAGHTVYPSVAALKVIQDKFAQKTKLRENGIKVPDFYAINSIDELREYAAKNGYPIMLKSRKGGYDGKGNYVINGEHELAEGFDKLNNAGGLMTEQFIDFEAEYSVVATRAIDGAKAVYPISFNVQTNNIFEKNIVPAPAPADLQKELQAVALRVMDVFEGVGTFCVEMFVGKDGTVSVNEVAPRPHNSGHYTIEGCRVNQFENHIRAILGLPLGDTSLMHGAVIVRNLLGKSDGKAITLGVEEAYKLPGINVHIYGKTESKTGRKMGHYTVTAATLAEATAIDEQVSKMVRIEGR